MKKGTYNDDLDNIDDWIKIANIRKPPKEVTQYSYDDNFKRKLERKKKIIYTKLLKIRKS